MAKAVHVGNQTAHGVPLTGNGSPNVFINGKPAWRAIPAGVGNGLEEATKAIKKIMDKPLFAPPDVAPELPKIQTKMMDSASKAAQAQNPTAVAGVTTAFVSLTTTTVALTAAYTAGAAVPGGEPAARSAFTIGFKTALSTAAGAAVTAIGGSWDMHTCSLATPNPHGPGLMTQGAETVFINGFRAAMDEEMLFEATQGPVGVSTPSQNVFIGKGVSFGGGGAGSQGKAKAASQARGGSGASNSSSARPAAGETANPAEEKEEKKKEKKEKIKIQLHDGTFKKCSSVDFSLRCGDEIIKEGKTDGSGWIELEMVPADMVVTYWPNGKGGMSVERELSPDFSMDNRPIELLRWLGFGSPEDSDRKVLISFQSFRDLPLTGVLDEETESSLQKLWSQDAGAVEGELGKKGA